jgi:rod shape-determining protein MreD
MNESKTVSREDRTRKYLGFFLFIAIGAFALIIEGVMPGIGGVRAELLLLVVIYIGIYKSPGTGVLITLVLGLLVDLYSGAPFGEGVFYSFLAMGCSRLVSRIVYANRPFMLFIITLVTVILIHGILAIVTLLWGKHVGTFGSFALTTFLSALFTAAAGLAVLPLLKIIDPERGGYYLTRFMREEWGEPLV